MKTWNQFLTEKTEHEFSSTQVNLPLNFSNHFVRWSKQFIDKKDLSGDGLEDEPHVTVLFGLHTNNPDKVRKALKGESPIHLKFGKVSIFEAEEFDVVKLSVNSDDLIKLNRKLRDNCEHTMTHPKYIPHCTVAYVKSGSGKKYVGNSEFDGTEITINTVLFSNKTREKTPISLK